MVVAERFQEFESVVDLGRYYAEKLAGKMAYAMLRYGTGVDEQLTYGQLHQRACALAAKLTKDGLSGRNALLLFPPGLQFIESFLGCLYAGVIAVPTPLPGRKGKDWKKTSIIAQDAETAVVLTVSAQSDFIRNSMSNDIYLQDVPCIETDLVPDSMAEQWIVPDITRDTIAFLQYTSGSTGTPKGVMVSHGNLLHNQEMMRKAYQHTEDTVFVSWLPLFHDMGLIGNVLHTLYLGGQCYLMTPVAFLQQPIRWLQAISDYKATTSFAPNFAYELCLRRISKEQRDALDLSHWTLALNGAEPVRADTLERFVDYFGPSGFKWTSHYPAYGLAEATLFVSGTGCDEEPVIARVESDALRNHKVVYTNAQEDSQLVVSSGKTDTVQDVVIVDPDSLRRCASNEVGEIWIAGGSVAQGYWKKPEQTKETFKAFTTNDKKGPYLRTGDLGFIDDGSLFVTGRLKDMVIVNGQNYYPQDIEFAVQEGHASLRRGYAAVFGIEQDGVEKVVVVQEVERTHIKKIDPKEVFENIRNTVSREFQIPVAAIVLIKPMTLPLTSSGKVQRRGTRKQFYDDSLAEVASWYCSEDFRLEVKNSAQAKLNDLATKAPEIDEGASYDKANEIIHWLRSYSETRINSTLMDERRCVPPYIIMDFAQRGLLGMCVSTQSEGLGLKVGDSLRIIEQLAAIDANLAALVSVHHVLGTRPIMNYGAPDLKQHYLPRIAQGRILGALAITEPGAGSNPYAVRTIARPVSQDAWLISGEKCWIGNGSWAGVINTLVQVVDEAGNPKGMAVFAIDQGRAGLRMGEEAPTMGMRGMVQNRVHLNNVHVTKADMLGRVGQGMDVAQDAMMHGRLVIAAMSLGGLKRAAQLMSRYARRREVATGRLLDNPVSIQRLSELHASIAAVQAMVRTVGECIDEGVEVPPEIYSVCKTSAPEFLWTGVDQLMQMLGGRGYTENNTVAQMMRDLRLFRIFEGPTEALNVFLGARVINHGKSFMGFVESTLQAPEIAKEVAEMAAEILRMTEERARSLGMSSGQINQWAQSFIGELTTLHVLDAFVRYRNKIEPGVALQQAQDWLSKQIEIKRAQVTTSLGVSQVWMSPAQLLGASDALAQDIGDIQQQAADMERDLDALLKRDDADDDSFEAFAEGEPQESVETKAKTEATPFVSAAPSAASEEEEVESWVIAWLSKHMRLSADEVDAQTTFVDIGMDSVSAVEFSFALQTWLGFDVDSTVVWQYTTIGSLSKFLVQEKTARSPSTTTTNNPANAASTEDLSVLSDDEVANALADELD